MSTVIINTTTAATATSTTCQLIRIVLHPTASNKQQTTQGINLVNSFTKAVAAAAAAAVSSSPHSLASSAAASASAASSSSLFANLLSSQYFHATAAPGTSSTSTAGSSSSSSSSSNHASLLLLRSQDSSSTTTTPTLLKILQQLHHSHSHSHSDSQAPLTDTTLDQDTFTVDYDEWLESGYGWLHRSPTAATAPAATAQPPLEAPEQDIFTLCVDVTVEEKHADALITYWRDLAAFCQASEPQTLTYELYSHAHTKGRFLIYERYVNEEALTKTHWTSESFLNFRSKLGILQPTATRTYWIQQASTQLEQI